MCSENLLTDSQAPWLLFAYFAAKRAQNRMGAALVNVTAVVPVPLQRDAGLVTLERMFRATNVSDFMGRSM